ncbi:MAG: hypothetical protein U0610_10065 [bacterium]
MAGEVVLTKIQLFRQGPRRHDDSPLWVDSTFESARQRAVTRTLEELPPQDNVRAHESIALAAQRNPLECAAPRGAAALVSGIDSWVRGTPP